jgi:hypothetical protein
VAELLRLVEGITIIFNNFGFKMVKLTPLYQQRSDGDHRKNYSKRDRCQEHFSVLVFAQLARRKATANTAVYLWSIVIMLDNKD